MPLHGAVSGEATRRRACDSQRRASRVHQAPLKGERVHGIHSGVGLFQILAEPIELEGTEIGLGRLSRPLAKRIEQSTFTGTDDLADLEQAQVRWRWASMYSSACRTTAARLCDPREIGSRKRSGTARPRTADSHSTSKSSCRWRRGSDSVWSRADRGLGEATDRERRHALDQSLQKVREGSVPRRRHEGRGNPLDELGVDVQAGRAILSVVR